MVAVFGVLLPLPVSAQTAAQAQAQAKARAQVEEQNRLQNQAEAQERNQLPAPAPSQPATLQLPAPAATPDTPPAIPATPRAPLDTALPPFPAAPDTSAGSSVTASDYARSQKQSQTDPRSPEQVARAADQDLMQLIQKADPSVEGKLIPLPVDGAAALGDDLPVEERISLEEALDRTVNNSYSFKAITAQTEGAGYARKAALGQLGPTVDVRTQRGREFSSPASIIDPETGKAVIASNHRRWDATVQLRQPLFQPGSYFDYKKTGKLADAADSRREDARSMLYYTTIKAYFDLLKAYSLLSFAQGYEKRMEQLQDYMQKRLEGGGASKIDLDRVRGRTLSAQSSVIESQGALESAMVSLEQLTGIRASKMVMPDRIMPAVPNTSKEAMANVYENNPGIRAARQEIDAAAEELKSARSRFSPTFAIELSQQRYSGAGGDNTLTIDRKAMLVMTMNLLNGGSDYYYQKEIGTKFVEKSNTAADIERKVKEQLEVNYRTLTAITKRSNIARQEYMTNSKVADEFLEQLGTGSKQLLDVLDAYQRAYQSRVDFAQLLFLQSDISYQILRNAGSSLKAADLEARSVNQSK
ncbi:MAG TPA: TolC family protein [Herbaspirillum sp.]|jgi:adhesin transport system outer membrane protein